jgi:gluconolactonase
MAETLSDILESTQVERLATGFEFTEGPLWHPDGFFYFVDIRKSRLYRIYPGKEPEVVRENTAGSNGTTFDLEGRLILCESDNRRLVRLNHDGSVAVLADRYEGKRLNRPNDVVCRSDGNIYFTDPGMRLALEDRELPYAGVYRLAPDGGLTLIADCEYPNGLAFSPDERTLYVANSRWAQYIHALSLDPAGNMTRRRVFADLPSAEATVGLPTVGAGSGVPDGMKLDAEGRIFCTGPGGTWVFSSDGAHIGTIETPEIPANLAFGGPDLRTLFFTARTSVYTMRVKTPGPAHPWYAKR